MNGMNGMAGMNGMNGMNGMAGMQGHRPQQGQQRPQQGQQQPNGGGGNSGQSSSLTEKIMLQYMLQVHRHALLCRPRPIPTGTDHLWQRDPLQLVPSSSMLVVPSQGKQPGGGGMSGMGGMGGMGGMM